MKNYLLILFTIILISGNSFSQCLSLYDTSGTPIPNGSEYIVDVAAYGVEQKLELHVKNSCGYDVIVKCKKTYYNICDSTTNYFCWGGICYGEKTMVGFQSDTIPANSIDSVNFSGHYTDSAFLPCCSKISYTFFNKNNPNDSVMVKVLYRYKTTDCSSSINEKTANNFYISAPYPNPSNSNVFFNYAFEYAPDAKLAIYNIKGVKTGEYHLKSKSGEIKIETGIFDSGIYFYQFTSGSNILKSGKFILSE